MSLEIINLEEISTKIKIKGYLKNITDNEIDIIDLNGVKSNNSITYIKDETKYQIEIINKKIVHLIRENKEFKHTFIFENNKTNISEYYIKEHGLNIEIEIKVVSLYIEENKIYIKYMIVDTNTTYEYKIEMSERI